MSFVKDMFREFGFAFCVSEIFSMFFESCVEVSVGSSYIKFVAVGACQFINPLPVMFVIKIKKIISVAYSSQGSHTFVILFYNFFICFLLVFYLLYNFIRDYVVQFICFVGYFYNFLSIFLSVLASLVDSLPVYVYPFVGFDCFYSR